LHEISVDHREMLDFVGAALRDAARSGANLAAVTIPAPRRDPLRAVRFGLERARSAGASPALFWSIPDEATYGGAGEAAVIRAVRGDPDRFTCVRNAAAELWSGLFWRMHPQAKAPPPRLFGGFSFAGGGGVGPWRAFGDAVFWLPRCCYGSDAGNAWITLALRDPRRPHARTTLIAELRRLLCLLADPRSPFARPALRGRVIEQLSTASWRDLCAEVIAAIAAGRCQKVVIARRTLLSNDEPIAAAEPLQRLRERFADCTAFALARGREVLIGATPELLVSRRGNRVRSAAVAGTAPLAQGAEAHLLASDKDRAEHDLVVRAVAEALRPICSELSVPAVPRVRSLPHLLHLHTPIVGELLQPRHVLELVSALHPTPAVGGVPARFALEWITAREPEPRGWYAAPVGWFDATGDGEFAVAIRSALVSGRRAHVFAGAGVVAGSTAEAEYAETALKQRALLEALGALL
jgi:menaquinone-specific isochorismate synthase